MIKYFDEPKKITLREFFEDSKKKYIQIFEYGDYGNWVTAIIENIDLSLEFTKKYTKSMGIFKVGDWSISLKTTYIHLYDYVNRNYNEHNELPKFVGFNSKTIIIRNLSQLYDIEIKVNGFVIDD